MGTCARELMTVQDSTLSQYAPGANEPVDTTPGVFTAIRNEHKSITGLRIRETMQWLAGRTAQCLTFRRCFSSRLANDNLGGHHRLDLAETEMDAVTPRRVEIVESEAADAIIVEECMAGGYAAHAQHLEDALALVNQQAFDVKPGVQIPSMPGTKVHLGEPVALSASSFAAGL